MSTFSLKQTSLVIPHAIIAYRYETLRHDSLIGTTAREVSPSLL